MAGEILCDWCMTPIPLLRTSRNKIVAERVVFYAPPGSPAEYLTVHCKCATHLHERKLLVKSYILATSTSYPVRPGISPVMRNLIVKFDVKQWSKHLDLAGSKAHIDPEKYLLVRANQGRVDPSREWAIWNDAQISPEEKDKVEAVPRDVLDVNQRGDLFRALKKAHQS